MKPKVLFIDNERRYVARHIEHLAEEYDVVYLSEVNDALDAMADGDKYSCFIVDVMMPVSVDRVSLTNNGLDTGIWMISQVEEKLKDLRIPVILFTNRQHSDVVKGLKESKLSEGQVIVKPKDDTNPKQLLELVREQINRWIR